MAQHIPETSSPEKLTPPNKISSGQAPSDKIRPEKPSPPQLVFGEILSFAYDTFCSNKVRFALTSLGMVIGTASLILVVTIGMTGKQYILNQIQSIGTNWIYAEYQGGAQRVTNAPDDPLTLDDMNAARQEVPGIVAASPVAAVADEAPTLLPGGGAVVKGTHVSCTVTSGSVTCTKAGGLTATLVPSGTVHVTQGSRTLFSWAAERWC